MAIATVSPGQVIFLGGLNLIDFATPSSVRFTPTQNVMIHKFIGGTRHMDVLGEDNDTVKWSGTFLGPTASPDAALMNAYVVGGEPQTLTFGTFAYDVVIKQAAFDYRGPFLIDYAIECYVLQDGKDEDNVVTAFQPQGAVDAAGALAALAGQNAPNGGA